VVGGALDSFGSAHRAKRSHTVQDSCPSLTYGYHGIPGDGGGDKGTRCLTKVRTPAEGAKSAAWIDAF